MTERRDPQDNGFSLRPERFPRGEPDGGGPEGGFRAPAPGSFTPRVKPAAIVGDTVPAGASFSTPTPAPLPEPGAPLFLFINLVAAIAAITFTLLLALKL